MAEAAQAYHLPTLKTLIQQHSITMSAECTDNPNMAGDAEPNWRCILRCGPRQLKIHFSHSAEPTAEDVLNGLASEASGSESFEDWCAEAGYDTNNWKAEHIYKICRRQAEALARFLGPELYEALLTLQRY